MRDCPEDAVSFFKVCLALISGELLLHDHFFFSHNKVQNISLLLKESVSFQRCIKIRREVSNCKVGDCPENLNTCSVMAV